MELTARKRILLALVFGCVASGAKSAPAAAPDPTSALIQGFAKYQAGRIESLVLDEFIESIASEKIFQQFFPETSEAVNGYSGISAKRLIPLIQYYTRMDIEKVKDIVDEVRNDKTCIERLVKHFKVEKKSTKEFSCANGSYDEPAKTIITVSDGETLKNLDLEKVSAIANETVFNSVPVKKTDSEGAIPAAVYMDRFFELMHAAGIDSTDGTVDFNRLKSGALFLAQLKDASDKKDVAAVEAAIADFINEDNAYNSKRSETGIFVHRAGGGNDRWGSLEHTLFVSSYFGVALNDARDDSSGIEGRAFGPVGVELKITSWNGAPVGLNFAPVDIGAYVTNELKGEEYTAKVEDIKAPSVFLSCSFRNRPISLMLGYQKGIKSADGSEDSVAFLSVAFDLPLYAIF